MTRRFWFLILIVLVACGLRLYRVTNPILDSHHWRQGTTASIAWHYYSTDGNFLRAYESGWGPQPKLFLNELPLFPYLVSLIYRVVGFQEIAGRLLSIFFSLLALLFLYWIARKYLGEGQALASCTLYAVYPMSIYYSRTFQRQSLALCLALAAIWFFGRSAERPCWKDAVGWVLCLGIGLQLNPPIMWAAFPMALLMFHHRGKQWWKSWDIFLGGVFALGIGAIWYWYAMTRADAWSLRPMGREGFREFSNPSYYFLWMSKRFFKTVFDVLSKDVLTPFGVVVVLLGLFPRGSFSRRFVGSFLVGVFVYFCLDVYPIAIGLHDYYYINAVPALALCGGKGLEWLWRRRESLPRVFQNAVRTVLLAGVASIAVLALVRGQQDQYTYNRNWATAAMEVRILTPEDALILVDQDSVGMIYNCHREGWHTMHHRLKVSERESGFDVLKDYIREGARYFVVTDVAGFEYNKPVADFVKAHAKLIVDTPKHYLFEFLPIEEFQN